MTHWMHECSTTHGDTCSSAPGRMPARLVDIGPTNPRLVETHQHHLKYTALSYCWGVPSEMNAHLKTLISNYESHSNGMSVNTMPETLRDAVRVTRLLGIKYLWIDAICIIQDSRSDWEQEAVHMGQIYRGAEVTIVAAAATTSNEGFLERPSDRMSARIPYGPSTNGLPEGFFELWERVLPHMDDEITVRESCWNSRAWTFQEQHLSTRALYFGTHVTHFQCQRLVSAENSATTSSFWPAPWAAELGVQDPARIAPGQQQPVLIHDAWFDMVEDYSARGLTVPSDKLPALSSLADTVKEALWAAGCKDQYCAGIWREDIVRGLLWKGKYDMFDPTRLSRATVYRAPTWSWAAFDGQVHWPARWRTIQPECEVVGVDVAMANPTGQVLGGVVTISGKLRRVDGFEAYTEKDWKARLSLSYSHAVMLRGCRVADGDIDCGEGDLGGGTVWALLLASSPASPTDEIEESYVGAMFGLLLRQVTAERFRRTGTFWIEDSRLHDFAFFHQSVAATISVQ